MRISRVFRMPFRRRREGKTDYDKRLKLIKSGKIRVVIRKSNKHFLVQFVKFEPKGDKTLLSVNSKVLTKFGFNPKINSPTAYLTGLYSGKQALNKGIKDVVVDADIRGRVKKGLNIMVLIKGLIDAGLNIPFDPSYVDEERLSGKHLGESAYNLFLEVKEKVMK